MIGRHPTTRQRCNVVQGSFGMFDVSDMQETGQCNILHRVEQTAWQYLRWRIVM
jgi:hypothetical protein